MLFLDDDVWLEPGALARMSDALDALDCGFVGMAPQGLSHLNDRRPEQTRTFAPWQGPVTPERIRPGEEGFQRWPLHSAANLTHLSAELGLGPEQWIPYKVAWLGGCTMFRRQALEEVGGFRFGPSCHPSTAARTSWPSGGSWRGSVARASFRRAPSTWSPPPPLRTVGWRPSTSYWRTTQTMHSND